MKETDNAVEQIIADDVFVNDGWYSKPHYLIRLAIDRRLTKTEYVFLDILFHFENRFTSQPHSWFFCDNNKICGTRLIARRLIKKTRDSLKTKGIIDFKEGHSHHSTEYRILLDGYYRGCHFGA